MFHTSRTTTFIGFSFMVLSVLPLSSQAGNLVLNGSFEDLATYGPSAGPFAGDLGNTPTCNSLSACVAVPDWTSASSLSFLFTTGVNGNVPTLLDGGGSISAADGANFAGSDGSFGVLGPISQTLTGLTVGQSYDLSFDQAAAQLAGNYGATSEQWVVTIGGTLAVAPTNVTLPDSSTIAAYVVNSPDDQWTTPLISNASGGFSGWQAETFTFTASATSELLAFLGEGAPQGAPPLVLLDNVSVLASTSTTGGSPAPEPASMALGLLGAGLLAAAIRRRPL